MSVVATRQCAFDAGVAERPLPFAEAGRIGRIIREKIDGHTEDIGGTVANVAFDDGFSDDRIVVSERERRHRNTARSLSRAVQADIDSEKRVTPDAVVADGDIGDARGHCNAHLSIERDHVAVEVRRVRRNRQNVRADIGAIAAGTDEHTAVAVGQRLVRVRLYADAVVGDVEPSAHPENAAEGIA
jgi:hypothetical protein